MNLLKKFIYNESTNINGKAITREAVRGIIRKGDKLLLIYSTENKDYKIPGGGVENGEDYIKTLNREILEECGAIITSIDGEFGKVIEYIQPKEIEYDVFIMTSYYYLCSIEEKFVEQTLDKYEEDLGFTPVWVDIDQAINVNNALIKSRENTPRWTPRDTFILEEIKKAI